MYQLELVRFNECMIELFCGLNSIKVNGNHEIATKMMKKKFEILIKVLQVLKLFEM